MSPHLSARSRQACCGCSHSLGIVILFAGIPIQFQAFDSFHRLHGCLVTYLPVCSFTRLSTQPLINHPLFFIPLMICASISPPPEHLLSSYCDQRHRVLASSDCLGNSDEINVCALLPLTMSLLISLILTKIFPGSVCSCPPTEL